MVLHVGARDPDIGAERVTRLKQGLTGRMKALSV
jgi:hypothetical protein